MNDWIRASLAQLEDMSAHPPGQSLIVWAASRTARCIATRAEWVEGATSWEKDEDGYTHIPRQFWSHMQRFKDVDDRDWITGTFRCQLAKDRTFTVTGVEFSVSGLEGRLDRLVSNSGQHDSLQVVPVLQPAAGSAKLATGSIKAKWWPDFVAELVAYSRDEGMAVHDDAVIARVFSSLSYSPG